MHPFKRFELCQVLAEVIGSIAGPTRQRFKSLLSAELLQVPRGVTTAEDLENSKAEHRHKSLRQGIQCVMLVTMCGCLG